MPIDHAKRQAVMRRSIALGHCICDPGKGCPCDTLKNDDRCPCAGETAPVKPADGPLRLTQHVRSAGCSSKIGKAQLHELLAGLPEPLDPRVLIGSAAGDDAGVVHLDGCDRDLVLTVDVFTPPVDDPYAFGRIAAANSLSDVWAMGGKAECALSVLGWPMHDLPAAALREVVRGGLEAMAEAGVPVVGGHSINAAEPLCGYAVVGSAAPGMSVRNQGARPGDVLVLSKALGGGILAFAQQIGRCPPEALAAWTAQMCALNRIAGEAMTRHGASAGTDVTGFGLLGHLLEIARRNPVVIELDVDALPLHPGVKELARAEVWPGALERNREAVPAQHLDLAGLAPAQVALLFCPETSGGILACLRASRVEAYRAECAAAGVTTTVIGRVAAAHATGLIRAVSATAAAWTPLVVARAPTPAPVAEAPACCSAPEAVQSTSSLKPQASSLSCGLPPSAGAAAFAAYMKAVSAPGALDAKTKKLIALALSVAQRCEPCVDINARGAREAGASEEQLGEAVALGIAFGGAPTAMAYNRLRS